MILPDWSALIQLPCVQADRERGLPGTCAFRSCWRAGAARTMLGLLGSSRTLLRIRCAVFLVVCIWKQWVVFVLFRANDRLLASWWWLHRCRVWERGSSSRQNSDSHAASEGFVQSSQSCMLYEEAAAGAGGDILGPHMQGTFMASDAENSIRKQRDNTQPAKELRPLILVVDGQKKEKRNFHRTVQNLLPKLQQKLPHAEVRYEQISKLSGRPPRFCVMLSFRVSLHPLLVWRVHK